MPGNNAIDGIKAWIFDAYGTLFDVHSAVGNPTTQFPQRFDNLFIHSIYIGYIESFINLQPLGKKALFY